MSLRRVEEHLVEMLITERVTRDQGDCLGLDQGAPEPVDQSNEGEPTRLLVLLI